MSRVFPGTQHLYVANGSVQLGQPYTLACWCVAPNVTPTQPWFTNPENMIFQMDSGGVLLHNGSWVVSAGGVLANNVPFHAAAVANGASSIVYKDGVQVASGNSGGGVLSQNLYIGARSFAGTFYLTGRMCECALWEAALTPLEIRALAKGVSPKVVRPLRLRGYWPLWGTAIPDVDLSPWKVPMQHTAALAVGQAMGGSPMAL